jgi:hypothetical protein
MSGPSRIYVSRDGTLPDFSAVDLVLLDCDDVLLDYIPGIEAFARENGLSPAPGGPGCFDLSSWLGISATEARRLVARFNEGADSGFDRLPPIPGAVEGVRALREAGMRIRVVSSFSDSPVAIRSRMDNLDRWFGPDAFEGIDALPLGGRKADALKRHPPSPFVDDLLENVRDAARIGHRGIWMQAHHNAAAFPDMELPDGIAASRDWPHLLDLLGHGCPAPAP